MVSRKRTVAPNNHGGGGGQDSSKRAKMEGQGGGEKSVGQAFITTALIGREKEVATISAFLEKHTYSGLGGSLYICGSTGTGKTASVTECLRSLDKSKCVLASLNGNSFSNPNDVYLALEKRLNNSNNKSRSEDCNSSESARKLLDKLLVKKSSRSKLFLAVIDEIDQLLSGQQNVLYQLFEWANRSNSNFLLVGIANAVDIHDRFLPNLEAVGYQPQVLVYPAYNKDQLEAILRDRMKKEAEAKSAEIHRRVRFGDMALELCARKIAAKSGDLRKGLGVCKRAILVATEGKGIEQEGVNEEEEIIISHSLISRIVSSLFNSPHVEAMQGLPLQAQYALIALAVCTRRKERNRQMEQEEQADKKTSSSSSKLRQLCCKKKGKKNDFSNKVLAQDVYDKYRSMTKSWKLPHVPFDTFVDSLSVNLVENSLIVISQGQFNNRSKKAHHWELCPTWDDVEFAFEDSPSMHSLLSGKENREFGVNLYQN